MTLTAEPTLFDLAQTITRPPTILGNDSPRTRRTDPQTSHLAGDVSQKTIRLTKVRVLQVLLANPDSTGLEINDMYLFMGARKGWTERVAPDSPRKRAGELAADGYLEIVGTRPAFGRGTSSVESIYRLTDKGHKVITLGHGA